ncbi:MAG TPA: dihydroorotate dehydrogenase-like protein [Clostridiales bacterium]|nr:dihydroorotate dehydrogenase-like protein [Clostridiales bacterium]HQP70631.1 dihydroorotate dehydrogenase-like protein [Clostridiales bacterium]
MTDLSVEVAGLKLKNPLIIGSCSYTESVESIKKLEEAGAGAVVLKSLFQEQIMNDAYDTMGEIGSTFAHPELNDYVRYFEEKNAVGNYLDLIVQAKAAVKIPVIASINCASFDKWVEFSSEIEKAGADGLEINLYYLPSDPAVTDHTYVSTALKIAAELKKHLKIPFSFKLGYYSDTLAKDLLTISRTDAKALVLFNKPFNPDIDIENEKMISGYPYSAPSEISNSLRWIAIMSDFAETDLIATTGVHNGQDIVKQILAGAKAVQMTSSLYLNSFNVIGRSLNELRSWMEKHNYKELSAFRGKLSRKDNAIYDRVQFLRRGKGE